MILDITWHQPCMCLWASTGGALTCAVTCRAVLQFVREFAKLGLTRSVGGVLALALARELTPVVTAIILAGRVGSAFAAELGTMQVRVGSPWAGSRVLSAGCDVGCLACRQAATSMRCICSVCMHYVGTDGQAAVFGESLPNTAAAGLLLLLMLWCVTRHACPVAACRCLSRLTACVCCSQTQWTTWSLHVCWHP
jgi:hypothetical protein